MPESTAAEKIEQALADASPGEGAWLLQKLAGQIGGVVPGIDTDPAVCAGEACIARIESPEGLFSAGP